MLLSLLDIELNLLILLCFVNGRQMSLKNMHYHLKQVQMQDINVLENKKGYYIEVKVNWCGSQFFFEKY